MNAAQRYAAMTYDERTDLLRRFNLFIEDANDNHRARITFDEADMIIWLANRAEDDS